MRAESLHTMTNKNCFLEILHERIRRYPAWLPSFSSALGLSESDQEMLVDIDERYMAWTAEMRKARTNVYQRPVFDPILSRERRRESLSGRISELKKELVSCRITMAREDDEVGMIMLKSKEAEIISETARVQKKIIGLEKWKDFGNTSKRDAARLVPLSAVVGKTGMIACPLHEDKSPSFSVRAKGHCFSCGKNLDSIEWLMVVNGMTFGQAIEELSRMA